MNVYLVRHTSVDVPRETCYGQSDVPLKPTFPKEAALVKEKLENLFPDKSLLDAVYSSPLSRCTRLAEFCGYGFAVREPRILELNFGEWEMQNYNEITDPHLQVWFQDWINVRPTGGESFRDQFNRVSDFLQELKGLGMENVLLFCHGGVLACAKVLSGRMEAKDAFSELDDYGSVIQITL